jgi:multiple sugar transport system permease protein
MSGLGMGIKSGVFIYLFRQFFRGIPYELEESAQIDGAGAVKIFTRIMLPNARGAIITVALLAFVWQWNDNYYTSLFIADTNEVMATLSSRLTYLIWNIDVALRNAGYYAFIGQDISKNPFFFSMIQNAGGILAMSPLLVLYFFVQRLFVEGVERSGIVG